MMEEKFFMEILQSREDRRDKQVDILKKYNLSLISFTLNTPGIIKDNEMYREIHKEGMDYIVKILKENEIKIIHKEEINKTTGSEGYIVVDFDPMEVKKTLIKLEEDHALGRIFDIDVFDKTHKQISRSNLNLNPRRCLICNKIAKLCIREGNHSYEELYSKIEDLWSGYEIV